MEIVKSVISRLSTSIYPITQSSLERDINQMIGFQLNQLEDLSPLEQQRIIELIVSKYQDAMVQPGEPVGVNGALTLGENLVQSSLQSHHQAGLKRGAAGFDRIEEITNMKNKSNIVKVITTSINGESRNKEEINMLSNLIVKVLMNDITVGYDIITVEEKNYPKWYPIFTTIRAIPSIGIRERWLRIYFDPTLLYKHRISLPAIASVIEQHINIEGYVFYPPLMVNHDIDTYLDDTMDSTLFVDIHLGIQNESSYYIKLGDIQSLQVGGIASVEQASPIPENLLSNIRVIQIGDDSGKTIYEVQSSAASFIPPYAWEKMIKSMVPDATIIGTTGKRFSSMESLSRMEDMIVNVPLLYNDITDGTPIENPDGTILVSFRQELLDKYPYLEYADLEPRIFNTHEEMQKFLLEIMVEYHYFWYIEAVCEKVQDLYILSEVDTTRTYTTSPIDCKNTLGYLAMRNMLFDALRENININSVHIKLIINNMTLYKEPVSIKRHDLRNDKCEWLTYTTFEDILKYITYAAFAGETDMMQSVSSHVLTGQMIQIGRGGDNMPNLTIQNPTGNKFIDLKNEQSKEDYRRKPRNMEKGRNAA